MVLLQRSEGGALGGGGSPTGLITTRGAGDLLTRTTWILFATFLTLSLALTLLGGRERSSQAILNRLKGCSRSTPTPFRSPGPPEARQPRTPRRRRPFSCPRPPPSAPAGPGARQPDRARAVRQPRAPAGPGQNARAVGFEDAIASLQRANRC